MVVGSDWEPDFDFKVEVVFMVAYDLGAVRLLLIINDASRECVANVCALVGRT